MLAEKAGETVGKSTDNDGVTENFSVPKNFLKNVMKQKSPTK